MSDSQLKCKYQSHNDEDIIAVCVNNDCKQPRLCCFTCMKDGHHQQHGNDILKFQQFNQWKQNGVKIIDTIKLVINEQENIIQLLKQLVIDNQKDIDLNIGYATATQIEQQINQINKLKMIDQIVKNDLDSLSQQIKKKIKELKSQIGTSNFIGQQQIQQQPIQTQTQIQKNVIQQQKIIPVNKQNIKFRFSEQDKDQNIQVTEEGRRVVRGDGFQIFISCVLCEPVLPKNVETTFSIKYIRGIVYIGVCIIDIIRNANYMPKLNNIGHGSYLINNNGLTDSHHQQEMNNIKQSFQFSQNDIIIMNVDLSKYKITWINQQTQQTFSMLLDQQVSDYHPFVCFLRDGEAQIVDTF